jgi:glycerate kinase
VLIAPDKFAGTLTAVEAAAAIGAGWRRCDPEAEILIAPMADGGPGFIDVLSGVVTGDRLPTTVHSPMGRETVATILLAGDTAYIETAQACGLHLVEPAHRKPEEASTYGVGQLVAAAAEAGAKRIVLGLGGSGTNDAGAGLLAALGATASGGRLDAGPAGLGNLTSVDLEPARQRVAGIELVLAADVESPLLGHRGATHVFGAQKGISEDRRPGVVRCITRFADLADRETAAVAGAGAAGGLGYALLLLGAECTSGVDLVADLVGLQEKASGADLVLTGEGAFDRQSGEGKVVAGVAKIAMAARCPCIVLAGRVLMSEAEMQAMGVDAAEALVDVVGEDRAFADPQGSLATVAERAARCWNG